MSVLESIAIHLPLRRFGSAETKKADVAEHPEVIHHVGLLINGPSSLSRNAPQLVVRQLNGPRRQCTLAGTSRTPWLYTLNPAKQSNTMQIAL